MQTLPTDLRKLVTEHAQDVRDALRKLRKPGKTEARITVQGGEAIIIQPLNPPKPAR